MSRLNPQALEAHNPFQGPIPGQSLTNGEEEQPPWEQPPEMTGVKDARELMFLEILKDENLENIVMLMNDGMSVGEVAEMLLFIGYSKGKFNADLLMLLIEPVMYMLLAIAEAVGIEPKIDKDDLIDADEEVLDEEDEEDIVNLSKSMENQIRNPQKLDQLQVDLESQIPQDIKERVAEIDFEEIKESLLARPTKEQPQNNSLLGR